MIERAIAAVKLDPSFCRMAEDAGAPDALFAWAAWAAEGAVRAVMEAMREPTAEMMAAFERSMARRTNYPMAFRAMFDAALAEDVS